MNPKIEESNQFSELSKTFLVDFESYRKDYFQKKEKNFERMDVRRMYEDLDEFTTGGKKLRGLLVYLGYLCAMGDKAKLKEILPISLAFEVLHSFFLIHDDIMDKADLRRSMPTIHKKYEKLFDEHFGVSMAILVGDIAAFEAMKLISESNYSERIQAMAIKFVIDTVLNTGYGQALDILYSHKKPTKSDIWEIIDYKTAKYSVVAPLVVGGIFGEATTAQLKAMGGFGLVAGRAFQLQDDLLGLFGDEKTLGKSILSDIREGKNTILIYKARESLKGKDLEVLTTLWGKTDATSVDLEEVKTLVIKSGALSWCEGEMEKLTDEATNLINGLTKDKNLVTVFRQMVDYIKSRRS